MTEPEIAAALHDCMVVVLKLGGPVLGVSLAVGLLISFIQAVTQINESTLAFLPKVVSIGLVLLLLAPFMTSTLVDFSHRILDRVVAIGGS